ncbi:MAG TPA: dethiobiotin synthase [Aquificaceae bacterium]|nr:dethiobiotin synthase [Aquificaceae bacterium]HIQ48767.1 dethiobiotin synthase [Aquifex aeolicus]
MRVLITGTDTGIGKTFITYNLAKALKKKGYNVGCYKPVETYVKDIPEDGSLLAKATDQSVDEVVPVRFSLPLAPYPATIEEKRDFSLDELRTHFEGLAKKYEILLVEGAGGIAVPIKKNYTYANLAKDWNLKVFIVARAGLGTLNHTYLTWYYAKNNGLEVMGIVLNGSTGKDISEKTNPLIIKEMTGIEPVVIPKVGDLELPEEHKEKLLDYFLSGFRP